MLSGVEKEVRWMVSLINIGPHGQWRNHIFKNLEESVAGRINDELGCEEGDVVLLCVGPKQLACSMLGRLRVRVIEKLSQVCEYYRRDAKDFRFLWVEDFPLFELRESEKKLEAPVWVSSHHPFTAPHPEDVHLLSTDVGKVRGLHFDLVLNGHEIGERMMASEIIG